MFRVLNGKGDLRADSLPHHVPGSGSNRDGAHRHSGTISGITGRLVICRHVVDSASRFQRLYGARDKSAPAILGVVKRFVAGMGVTQAFRTDNGAEYTNPTFVYYCNGLGIRRERIASSTTQQNGPVESGLSRTIKTAHAARFQVNKLFPDVHLERLKGVRDPWASEGFNRFATTANSGMLSPHKYFSGTARQGRSCRSARRRTIVFHGGAKWTPTCACVFPEFRIQPWKRLHYDDGRRDEKVHALARRYMTPAARDAYLPGPDSWIGSVPFIIWCRNAGLCVHPADTYNYCHACYCSSYRRAGACISCRRTRAATKPPSINSRSRCSETGVRGGSAYAWTHARRNARDEGLTPQHGCDVPCLIGAKICHPRGV